VGKTTRVNKRPYVYVVRRFTAGLVAKARRALRNSFLFISSFLSERKGTFLKKGLTQLFFYFIFLSGTWAFLPKKENY
jgi:hypothetical protein